MVSPLERWKGISSRESNELGGIGAGTGWKLEDAQERV